MSIFYFKCQRVCALLSCRSSIETSRLRLEQLVVDMRSFLLHTVDMLKEIGSSFSSCGSFQTASLDISLVLAKFVVFIYVRVRIPLYCCLS